MGLFGALFAGVSGLDSQSNKIGIISNNISNVNTVGFKQGAAAFDTLVVPSGTTNFSPGGVIGNTQSLVDQQGLIQATSSPTDIAITGNGFFTVNTAADGTGSLLLTRAGSFTQDANGNFVNANGFYLQGIPVTTPPTSVNTTNLQTVTVNQSATGAATATTAATLAANFDASQAVLPGSGEVATLKGDSVNASNTASEIIAPGGATPSIRRGDSFTVQPTNANKTDTFVYGGFTVGRNINATLNTSAATTTNSNTGLSAEGDGSQALVTDSIAANKLSIGTNSSTLTIAVSDLQNYQNLNQNITISSFTGTLGSLSANEVNGSYEITGVSGATGAGTITVTLANENTGSAVTNGGAALSLSNRTYAFTGNILNATAPGGDLLQNITNPASVFTTGALQFKITSSAGVTSTFTYNSQPDPTQGQFSSLNSLVTAIDESSNNTLTASVVGGQLYVSATDATQGLTFSNVDATGSSGLAGINWVQELGLPTTQIAGVNAAAATGTARYNTLQGLANSINSATVGDPTNLIATVNNATGSSATLSINAADPTSTITFADSTGNAGGSIIAGLGFTGSNGASLSSATNTSTGVSKTTTLPLTYSADSATTDMSSGAVTPQFSKDFTIYDSLGNAHTVALNVLKLSVNKWAVELTSVPASAVVSATNDGQIASGVITFNGDGSLNSVTGQLGANDSIGSPVVISWTQTGPNAVGANASTINFDLGTIGKSDGLTQSAAAFNVSTASQNGSPIGQLTGVTINQDGYVIETFSNGQTQQVFQIPLADVSNPNGLESVSGDAYQQTLASGQVNLNVAGQGGTGTITPSALEQSNVDLSTQLTNLIVAQQAYGANSKVLTIADQLLQELDQIIQ